jgi:hypothetical protein
MSIPPDPKLLAAASLLGMSLASAQAHQVDARSKVGAIAQLEAELFGPAGQRVQGPRASAAPHIWHLGDEYERTEYSWRR